MLGATNAAAYDGFEMVNGHLLLCRLRKRWQTSLCDYHIPTHGLKTFAITQRCSRNTTSGRMKLDIRYSIAFF